MSEEAIESRNVIEITPSILYRQIQYAKDIRRTPFIWGDPGVGKSAIINYIAEKFNYHIEDIRLSQIDSIDLRGLPVKSYFSFADDETDPENPEKGPIVDWAMPDFLARARKAKLVEGKDTIFFFDEFNSASKSTLAAAYQLVNDYRIGCFTLGEDDFVIAAGNYESNGGVTTVMPTPLSNRFIHYNLKVSAQEWLEFASHSGIHPWTISFIERNKPMLNMFNDEKINEDEKAFATPRSWHFASDLLYRILEGEVSNTLIDESANDEDATFNFETNSLTESELLKDIEVGMAGCVGVAVASKFRAFV